MVKRLVIVCGALLVIVWMLVLPVLAQGPADTWIREYGADSGSSALDAIATGDGGYLLVGAVHYSHENTDDEDIFLMQIDDTGEVMWETALGGERYDRGVAITAAAEGGYVVLAETRSFGAGGYDIYLVGIDVAGEQTGSQTFGGPYDERADAIQTTADGGYIITGSTVTTQDGTDDLYLLKVDAAGNEVWSRTFDEGFYERGTDVYQMPDGGFLVLAELQHGTGPYPVQDPDVYLVRTDAEGQPLWTKVQEADDTQGAFALLPTSDGNFLVTGIMIGGASFEVTDFLFLKINGDGDQLWDRTFGDETQTDYGTAIISTPDGGYLLTGMTAGSGSGSVPLVKTDADGAILWRRELAAGLGNTAGFRIFQTGDGGYLIVGATDGGIRQFRTLVIKTDAEGQVAP